MRLARAPHQRRDTLARAPRNPPPSPRSPSTRPADTAPTSRGGAQARACGRGLRPQGGRAGGKVRPVRMRAVARVGAGTQNNGGKTVAEVGRGETASSVPGVVVVVAVAAAAAAGGGGRGPRAAWDSSVRLVRSPGSQRASLPAGRRAERQPRLASPRLASPPTRPASEPSGPTAGARGGDPRLPRRGATRGRSGRRASDYGSANVRARSPHPPPR